MKIVLSLAIALICPALMSSQKNSLFKAGIMAGVSKMQVDGDHQTGFDRTGLCFGLRGGIVLRKNFDILVEMNYQTKGSLPPENLPLSGRPLKADIGLRYVEVPVLMNLGFRQHPGRGHYRNGIHLGVSYGRLLASDIRITRGIAPNSDLNRELAEENLERSDLSVVAGATFYLFRHNIGMNIRLNQSLTPFFEKPYAQPFVFSSPDERDGYYRLRSYFISAQVFYDFVAPKPKKEKKRNPRPVDPKS
jgi:hypothetical protein